MKYSEKRCPIHLCIHVWDTQSIAKFGNDLNRGQTSLLYSATDCLKYTMADTDPVLIKIVDNCI